MYIVSQLFINIFSKHVYSKVDNQHILQESLWDSKFIQIGNKPAHIPYMIKKGILCFKDVLSDECNILPIETLNRKYACNIKQMDYNCLIHSIPKSWKKTCY